METETTVERYSRYLQNLNSGATKSFQANINAVNSTCTQKITATNLLISDMFNAKTYKTGEISQADFLDKFQIMSFAGMDQFEQCGVNQFMIQLDSATNDLSNFGAVIGSVTTQLAIGFDKKDTSIYFAV
jgi:hypothetical protein